MMGWSSWRVRDSGQLIENSSIDPIQFEFAAEQQMNAFGNRAPLPGGMVPVFNSLLSFESKTEAKSKIDHYKT
jgi:hypothetical protein